MSGDYMGKTDAQMLSWMTTFSEHLTSSPQTYQVSVAEAASVQAAVDLYQAAYQDSQDPAQRNKGTVELKNEARNSAAQLCRQFAQLIRLNAGIDNQAKIDAGVRPINPNRDPIYCPSTSPAILVVAATMGAHTLRFLDTLNPESRGKPFGASSLQLFVAVDDEPVGDAQAAKFYAAFSKNPIAVAFNHTDNAKLATYFARWAGRRGDVSNWSNPVTMAIAA